MGRPGDRQGTGPRDAGDPFRALFQAGGDPAPRIACRNPLFEKDMPLPDSCILSDDELRALPERYACSARLAEEAGFDGVDIKACHRYLLNELLSAHTCPRALRRQFREPDPSAARCRPGR